MVRIALRMLVGDRAKYLSLVCGLSFAVLLIVQQGAIFMGLMLQATGPLQNISQPDLWVGDPYLKWVTETRNLSDTDLNRIRSTPGVAWAEPFFNTRAACDLPDGDFRFVNIVGIPRTTMVGRPPEITRGRLEDLRISDAVLVEESGRAKLGYPKIGDTLKLNDRRAVVVGFCRAKFGWDSPSVVYTTYENAITYVPLGRNKITYILVGVKAGADVNAVQRAISALPDLVALKPDELRMRTIRFLVVETGIGLNFGITVALGIVVGLTISAAIFYQFTLENLRHFAVLKALGATRTRLVGMVVIQAGLIGLMGYGVGVGGAALFCLSARKPGAELAAYFPWQLLLVGLAGTVLCLAAGSLLSLRRVLTLDPALVFKS